MPLDPSIILQATNINAEAAKATQQQQAQQAQQLQNYSVLQAKQDFLDQQNLRQAWRTAQGDPTKTVQIGAQLGVSPKALQAFQMQQIQFQNQLAQHDKLITDTGKTKLDMDTERRNNLYTQFQPLLGIKDPSELAAKLPAVINSAKNAGLINDQEAMQASTMDPGRLQDFATGLLNIDSLTKLHKNATDQQTADAKTSEAASAASKQANEAAGQIETSNRAKLEGAATQLTNALRTGGPVAYNKALQQFGGDDLIQGSFPKPEQIAAMPMGAAFSAINSGSMTSQQRTQAAESDRTAAQATANAAQTAQHQKAMEGLEAQRNGLAAQKFAAEYGGNMIQGWVQQIKQNPNAVSNLPPQIKSQVAMEFANQTGSPMPTKLSTADQTNINNAHYTQDQITNLKTLLSDPQVASTVGPLAGRIANGESEFGAGLSPRQQQAITAMKYLLYGEGKAIFGGRVPQQLIQSMEKVSAGGTKNIGQITGALDAANSAAQSRVDSAVAGQFGGKLPSWYQGGNSAAGAAPKTASLQDIQNFAKAHNMSVDAARKQAISEGYTVR